LRGLVVGRAKIWHRIFNLASLMGAADFERPKEVNAREIIFISLDLIEVHIGNSTNLVLIATSAKRCENTFSPLFMSIEITGNDQTAPIEESEKLI